MSNTPEAARKLHEAIEYVLECYRQVMNVPVEAEVEWSANVTNAGFVLKAREKK